VAQVAALCAAHPFQPMHVSAALGHLAKLHAMAMPPADAQRLSASAVVPRLAGASPHDSVRLCVAMTSAVTSLTRQGVVPCMECSERRPRLAGASPYHSVRSCVAMTSAVASLTRQGIVPCMECSERSVQEPACGRLRKTAGKDQFCAAMTAL